MGPNCHAVITVRTL